MTLLNKALKKLVSNYNSYPGNKGNFQWTIKKSYPKIFQLIKSSFGKSFNEKVYCKLNNIHQTPLCKFCNKKNVSFKNINEGFKTYCSDICANKDPEFRKFREQKMLEKYGVSHALQIKDIADVVSEKNKKQFDVNGTGRKNYIDSMQEKYGVENPMDLQKFRDKITETHSNRTISEIKLTTNKRKQTNLEKYGDENYRNNDKIKKTLETKYGVFHPNQIKCSKEWLAIKDKKKFLEETLPSLHPLKIAKDYNLAFSTVYKLINKYNLKDLVRKTFNSEYEIELYIKSLGFLTETNNRTTLNGKEIDILIPNKNIGIEHNGIYWHSELNGKDKNYHLNKTKQCNNQHIQLLHIFETEWLHQQQIVKSVIASKLGCFETRLFARKCNIKTITAQVKNKFLDEHHLQGQDKSSVKLGLFYDEKLVSVMTFGKSRFNKNYQYEMHRFCNKKGYQIIGGASKLWKYFLKNYNPTSVITYADRRYSDGTFYEKIGFTKIRESLPAYWYFGKNINGIANRTQFQKHLLKNKLDNYEPKLSEWQNMQNNGYDRIWDCGNFVFEWQEK
jgi:hypothetical protein